MKQDHFIGEIFRRSSAIDEYADLLPLIDKLKDKKMVMLGESTHGTKEYYEIRSFISRELVENHGFNFIAVEGDWPPCQEVNRSLRSESKLEVNTILEHFTRWPTWMWGNLEMTSVLKWMHEWNRKHPGQNVSFHGLDVYSLFESIDEVIKLYPQFADYYSCFEPYRQDEMEYVRSLMHVPEGCEREATNVLKELLHQNLKDSEDFFDAFQNARIINNAEKYYRSMLASQGDLSWNIRDRHMMETLETLLLHHGENAKGIVWAHNTHVGDYRATDMALNNQVNIGGLARERLGEKNVALVGFSTHRGSVIASDAWDGPVTSFTLPQAREETLEDLLKEVVPRVGSSDYFVTFDGVPEDSPLNEFVGHRAVGVVYSPFQEGRRNYVPTQVAKRYDAMIFLEVTNALTPLQIGFDHHKFPETWPFGTRI